MTKLLKRLSLLVLTLCVGLGVICAACSCEPKEENASYEVTITYESNPSLLATLTVELYDSSNKLVASKQLSSADSGKATFSLPAQDLTVKLKGLDESSYSYTAGKLSKTSLKCSIAITDKAPQGGEDETVEYRIVVLIKNADGTETPVAGARVQVCIGEECRIPVAADENGVAVMQLPADVWSIHLMEGSYPDGYTFDNEKYQTTAKGGEFKVYLEK